MEEKLNLRERKKILAREKILDAATCEFELRGFMNTSVSDIMKKSGLGVGTFYNYFGSKEEVLMEIVKKLFSEVEKELKFRRETNSSSLELLEIYCMRTAKLIDENRFILPLFVSAAAHSDKPEQLPENLSPTFKNIFERIISIGRERKEIRGDIPAELILEMFHSIYQAASFSKSEIPFQENVRLKIKILLDGIKFDGGKK